MVTTMNRRELLDVVEDVARLSEGNRGRSDFGVRIRGAARGDAIPGTRRESDGDGS